MSLKGFNNVVFTIKTFHQFLACSFLFSLLTIFIVSIFQLCLYSVCVTIFTRCIVHVSLYLTWATDKGKRGAYEKSTKATVYTTLIILEYYTKATVTDIKGE